MPALRHGVARVESQVHDDLFHHAFVGVDRRHLRREVKFQGDIGSERSFEHERDVANDFVQVQQARLYDLLAAEGEELTGEVRRPVCRRRNLRQRSRETLRQLAVGQQQVHMAFNDGEHVVEIMRHPGGKLADRFHFLRLAELGLQIEPLGNVLQAALEAQHATLGIADDADVFLHPNDRTVPPAQLGFEPANNVVAADQHLPPLPVCGIGVKVGRVDAQERFAVGVTEHLDRGRVGIHYPALGRRLAEADGDVVEQGPVPALRLFQRLPLPFSFQAKFYRAGEPGVMLGRFQHVVIQPGFHRFDGNLLAAGTGEHDDRTVRPAGFDHPQHGQPIGPAQLIIADDQIGLV